jgi:archaellum component FlaC
VKRVKSDYERLASDLNIFGKQVLKAIKNEYGSSMTSEQNALINQLLSADNFIIVNKPSQEDISLFGSLDEIPTAHGGRTKEDGKIHIYPYTKSFNNFHNYDDCLNICKNDLIIHEIFHYFIRPDVSNIEKNNFTNDKLADSFKHFLTEGLVQLYTEKFAADHNLPLPQSNYNANVRMANDILKSVPQEMNINKLGFQSDYLDILKYAYYYSGKNYIDIYTKELQQKEYLENLIKEIALLYNPSESEKIIRSKSHEYSKLGNPVDIIQDFQKQICEIFKNDEVKLNDYLNKLKQYDPIVFQQINSKSDEEDLTRNF